MLLVGPRQAGKTFLMRWLEKSLKEKNAQTLFFNLDLEEDRRFFVSQADLMRKIQLEFGKNKGYVFIDEIQRKENAGLFLKGIYDADLPFKLIVSGSGSLELKEKIHESLAGRKRVFEIAPISFWEFVDFKTNYQYSEKLEDFFQIETTKTKNLLEEYLVFGGYPKVVLAENEADKRAEIGEIYQSYLERDIKDILGLTKSDELTTLLKIIGSQIGNLTNYQELSSTVGLANKTVAQYLWYLEKTFILKKVRPFFRNKRQELTHQPVFYFLDLGLRNYLLGLSSEAALSVSGGFLFENFIFNLLREKLDFASTDLHFWRSRDHAEVDFIIEKGTELTPIEVKYKNLSRPEITRSFRNFLEKYEPSKAYLINLSFSKTLTVGKTKVIFLPFFDLLPKKSLWA